MNVSELQSLIGLLLGIATFIGGTIVWYKGSVQKSYAAERDFNHLRRNYEQMNSVLNSLCKEVEEINRVQCDLSEEVRNLVQSFQDGNRSVVEMKAHVIAVSSQLGGLYARLDSASMGWARRSE